jgi:hypothetical protein
VKATLVLYIDDADEQLSPRFPDFATIDGRQTAVYRLVDNSGQTMISVNVSCKTTGSVNATRVWREYGKLIFHLDELVDTQVSVDLQPDKVEVNDG